MALSELERLAIIARQGTSPVYSAKTIGATIPANRTLSEVIDDTFATDSDNTSTNSTLSATNAKLDALSPFAAITGSCANDAAAESAGVPVGGLYHTAGAIKVRLT
jgi:hypothetical protein